MMKAAVKNGAQTCHEIGMKWREIGPTYNKVVNHCK